MRKQIGFILIVAAVVAVRELVRYQRELLAQPGAQLPSWDRPLTNGYGSFVPYFDGGQIEYPVKYGYDPDPESEEDRYLHSLYDD